MDSIARSQWGSVDPNGAPNVDHVTAVFEGVLRDESNRLGRPLRQDEVDMIVLETVGTDAFLKGMSWQQNGNAPLTPLAVAVVKADGTIAYTPVGNDPRRGSGKDLAVAYAKNAPDAFKKKPFMAGVAAHGIVHPAACRASR